MSNIIVTLKNNVECDEDGIVLLNDEGMPKLLDPEDIGILTRSHPIMTVKYNQETGEIDSGYTTRAEVYWDKRRNPTPAFQRPTDLVWLEFMGTEEEEDDQEDDPDMEEEHLDGEENFDGEEFHEGEA